MSNASQHRAMARGAAAASLVLALWPAPSIAATVLSRLTADLDVATMFSGGFFPPAEDFEEASVLIDGLQLVEAFVPAGPLQIEGFNTEPGFASAAGGAFGNFGVGVNSLFLTPPNPIAVSIASGPFRQDILNDTAETLTLGTSVFIPAPVIERRG